MQPENFRALHRGNGYLIITIAMELTVSVSVQRAHPPVAHRRSDHPYDNMRIQSAKPIQRRFVKQNKFMEGLGAALMQKPYNVGRLGSTSREVFGARPRRY